MAAVGGIWLCERLCALLRLLLLLLLPGLIHGGDQPRDIIVVIGVPHLPDLPNQHSVALPARIMQGGLPGKQA